MEAEDMTLSSNANEICEKRYFQPGEAWDDLSIRVGNYIGNTDLEGEEFSKEICEMNFIPGGRTLRNSGILNHGLLNCACLPVADSIESIAKLVEQSLILWAYGAGIGVQFSTLRPKGAEIVTRKGESSGMLSFVGVLDHVSKVIDTGGQRRSGLMPICRVDHPEIREFIWAKKGDDSVLKYCNLSVAITDEFIRAVEDGSKWDLKFAGKVYDTVDAVELWSEIMDSQAQSGEPGLLNYTNLLKNNSYYFQRITGTNLCGELPLPDYGMCCLGSLVLPNFLHAKGSTNWVKLEKSIHLAVRFLDNVLDKNQYPIHQTKITTLDSRRIGLGTMGLHDYLIAKELRYGSEESLAEIEKLYKFIRNVSYEASIKLADEKGPFPQYSNEYTRASFVRKLPAKLRLAIKEHGIRNCTLVCSPPTGTTSLIPEVSPSIEPHFSLAYERKDRVSNRYYIHPEIINRVGNKSNWLVDSSDLTPADHLEVQSLVQKYTDNAVSKTINFPKGSTHTDIGDLLLEYIKDLKGVTVYVDGSRGEQPLNRLSIKQVKKILSESTESTDNPTQLECNIGGCE